MRAPSVRVTNLHAAYEARLGHTRPGRISGIAYAAGRQPEAARKGCAEPDCPLVYNGGSVQHTPHVYLLLWGPDWQSDPGQAAAANYLESFYRGLGVQPQDAWSITTAQYGDGTGHPTFNGTVYEGAWNDTSTPPSGVDQAQLAAEADAFTTSNKIADLTDAQIIVATQSGTCPAGFDAPGCSGGTGDYCAWHSSSNEPYTNLPYLPDAGSACGADSVNPGGTDDGFSLVGGREYAGSITDPFPVTGWQDPGDSSGGEIGDKCAGSSLTGDVTLSTGTFAMQPLWSNNANSCVMSTAGDVTVNDPGNQSTYQQSRLSLHVTGTSGGGYPLQWSAAGLPSGLTISPANGIITGQVKAAPGGYNVTVSATDKTGTSGSASFTWTVTADTGATVKNQGAGVCLNDDHYVITTGNPVVVWACNANANEEWTHTASNGELVVLGQCLTDPAHGGTGTAQVIKPCAGAATQLWYFNSKHEYVLQKNLLCLTDPGGSTVKGTQVDVESCTDATDQQWGTAASAQPAATDDTWPTFGHDPMHSGISPDTAIGASTASGLAAVWSRGLGTTNDQPSPAVAYNAALGQTLVYDVTYQGRVEALDAATGAVVWQQTIAANVYSSPAVYDGTLYVGDNNGVLEALDAATGAVQCTFTLPVVPPATAPGKIFSSPVVGDVDGTGPTVFFGDANVESGGHLWAVTGVGNTAGSCQEKWAYDKWANKGKAGAKTGVWGEPALAQERDGTWAVVVGSANPDNSVYAINAVTGARLWHFRTVEYGKDEDVGAGPTISAPGNNGFAEGVAYVDGKDGVEYALNLRSGREIWSFTLGPGSADALAVSEAALTGTTLVLGYAGSVFALNATTGAQLWEDNLGGTIEASPAVSGAPGDQALFVGDLDGHEYGLNLADGSQVFSLTTKGKIIDSTAVADGTLYFAGGSKLYAYSPSGASGTSGRVGASVG